MKINLFLSMYAVFKRTAYLRKVLIANSLTLAGIVLFSSASYASWQDEQASNVSVYECTQVALDNVDAMLLTKEERVALLDQSLTKSIDGYSSCVSTVTQNSSGGGGGGQGGGASNNEGKEGKESEEGVQNESQSEQDELEQTDEDKQTSQELREKRNAAKTTTAPRGIIAPKDNDKIICKLLFQEISNVQDADMLKGLKQQYANYQCG